MPPPGWQFWVPVGPPPGAGESPITPRPTAAPPASGSPAAAGASVPGANAATPHSRAGLFGARKRLREVESRNSELTAEQAALHDDIGQLRARIDQLRGMDAAAIEAEIEPSRAERDSLVGQLAQLTQQVSRAGQQLSDARQQLVETQEVVLLQEVGVYEYRHRLEDAVEYKDKLNSLRRQIKAAANNRDRPAVQSDAMWTVNGSAAEGRKMARETTKLMLRAYNAEADTCVRTMRPHRLTSCIDRLTKSRTTIARLGATMKIQISDEYHRLRIAELELTADHLAKVDEEKERIRQQRARDRDEALALREIERERERLAKEDAHWAGVQARMEAAGDLDGLDKAETRRTEIAASLTKVEAHAANTRAGWVYVISNIGAFGQRMVKIGMTRRLDPNDRIRELGDASVPFRFDTHALIFSTDAVGLEGALHRELVHRRVNRVNLRREFFHATPAEVLHVLQRIGGHHLLEYTEESEAAEWRASQRDDQANAGHAPPHATAENAADRSPDTALGRATVADIPAAQADRAKAAGARSPVM